MMYPITRQKSYAVLPQTHLADVLPLVSPHLTTKDCYHLSLTSRLFQPILDHHQCWQMRWDNEMHHLAGPNWLKQRAQQKLFLPPLPPSIHPRDTWLQTPYRSACLWLTQHLQYASQGQYQWPKALQQKSYSWIAWLAHHYPEQFRQLEDKYQQSYWKRSQQQQHLSQAVLLLLIYLAAVCIVMSCGFVTKQEDGQPCPDQLALSYLWL